ncbi:hypothetical protein SAY87_004142 [Trapa incisa]|uniref:Homeobox-leucine zipper protein n=1 Tax=Trapa incisa TaxID=236973 RepID=A0AAN7JNE8_9MYRT|nr:hypothetical protein SAY87_004142 [Trapa incisa]
MDFYGTRMQKTMNRPSQASRQRGKRLTEDQVKLLERSFSSNKKLDQEKKLQLARELGVPPRQVSIWYQNKRVRWKTQTLEVDYNSLQLKLDSAMAEKKELQKDVERLTAELRKALDMLALAGLGSHKITEEPSNNNNSITISSSCFNGLSGFCGDGSRILPSNNSGFSHGHHWKVDEDKNIQLFDDLYAGEMFPGGLIPSEYYR